MENIVENTSVEQKPATLEEYILSHQTQWTEVVQEMTSKMKRLPDLPELLNMVYAKRQDALDYYFGLLAKISAMSRDHKQKYAEYYNYYKTQSQIRYSSDSAINAQISATLKDDEYNAELLENHAKYMQETIKSIDYIIYAITNRIRIEELIEQNKR